MVVKNKGYKFAIEWIALNDDPTEMEHIVVETYISSLLVADLFGVEPAKVGLDVVKYREAESLK